MTGREAYERLVRARRFIDSCYDQPINLDAIAAEARLSRYHFLRQFQREFNTTPHGYLQQRRIERAKQLLAAGHHSVTDVCFEVGFQSLGSFSSLFHRVVGQPPGTYRARSLVVVPGLGPAGPLVLVPGCFISMFSLARPSARQLTR